MTDTDLAATPTSEVEVAKIDATRRFNSPAEIVTDTGLSLEQKLEILDSWKQDAMRLSESDDENMQGGEQAPLQAINNAIISLHPEGPKEEPTNR